MSVQKFKLATDTYVDDQISTHTHPQYFDSSKDPYLSLYAYGGSGTYILESNRFYLIITRAWTTTNAGGMYMCMATAGNYVTTIASGYNTTVKLQNVTQLVISGAHTVLIFRLFSNAV